VSAGEIVIVIDGQPLVLRSSAGRLTANGAQTVLRSLKGLSSFWTEAVEFVFHTFSTGHVILRRVIPSRRSRAGALLADVASSARRSAMSRKVIYRQDGLADSTDLLSFEDRDIRAGCEMSLKKQLHGLVSAVVARHRHSRTFLWGLFYRLRQVLRVKLAPFSVRPYFSGGMLFSAVRTGLVHASTQSDLCLLGLFHTFSVRQPLLNVNEIGGT